MIITTPKKPLEPQDEQVMPTSRPLTKTERKENRTKGRIIKKGSKGRIIKKSK